MSDTPLEKRAGYNQGVQISSLLSTRFAGQPGIKLTGTTTIVSKSAPGTNIRGIGVNPAGLAGLLLNKGLAQVVLEAILYDAAGNAITSPSITIPAGQFRVEQVAYNPCILALVAGWTAALRVTSGDFNDILFWPWSHDLATNFIALAEPLSTTELVIGPPPGRAWQLCGDIDGNTYDLEGAALYANFDSVDRHVTSEKVNLAGDDFLLNILSPVTVADQEFEPALDELLSFKASGFILAYPDKLKFKAAENQTSAPMYLLINFVEFDLPSDM